MVEMGWPYDDGFKTEKSGSYGFNGRHVKAYPARWEGHDAQALASRDPGDYQGHHRRDSVTNWYTGMVIWNFATELWDRVKIVDRHQPSMSRYRTMSYPIDEDDETEWRQQNG